uniref:Uncharacterized protein n=1 Tax=Trichobilharzia regenti TaxID=157069 RepID=A0AA85KFN1_TRIRE|nr:unnamed protein product [Trichobilharzia regenti]
MKLGLSEKMGNIKTTMNSRLVNHVSNIFDKYPRRVIVFLVVMCFITLGITPALSFIPKSRPPYWIVNTVVYAVLAILDITVICLLVLIDRIRKLFPSACLTVLTEVEFIGKDYIWVLVVMSIAVVLFIMCISIGATLKSELKVGSLGMLIGYALFSAALAAATLGVHFGIQQTFWALVILAVGTTILVIPIALFIGQITLGAREFRAFGTDYCMASLTAHAVLILFLITLGIALISLKKM